MRFNDERNAIVRARELRQSSVVPERKLWNLLKGRQIHDAKFRRQHPVGPYTADFYCAEVKLVIELDGHKHSREHDQARDAYMRGLGLHVLRISVSGFERDPLSALVLIARTIESLRSMKEAT